MEFRYEHFSCARRAGEIVLNLIHVIRAILNSITEEEKLGMATPCFMHYCYQNLKFVSFVQFVCKN